LCDRIETPGTQETDSLINVISGIGWIGGREYGSVAKKMRRSYSHIASLRSDLEDRSLLLYPLKGFGKYDQVSKMTCCVTALALYDAGMPYSKTNKQAIGIFGTNTNGCLQSNVEFFKDFLDNGRTLGRGSLFINTLPCTPVAQAALYFKCRGPLLYLAFPERQLSSLLRECDSIILRGESPTMLAVRASEEDAICFVLRREKDVSAQKTFGIRAVSDVVDSIPQLDQTIGALSTM
jgi:hypothetical protein